MRLIGSLWRRLFVGLAIYLALSGFVQADDLEGTWQLVLRKLPDGTVQTPPTVYGLASNKDGVNQLIVFWPTPDGKSASISQVSKWEWSGTEVAVTPILVIFDDGSGKPPVYSVGGETKRSPVTREGGRVSYQHPINAPFIVREGDKLTATLEGAFVDFWEKVK